MTQGDLFSRPRQAALRDRALDGLAAKQPGLVQFAYDLAVSICSAKGEVSSTDVWESLRGLEKTNETLRRQLAAADARWMGAVFRKSRGWKRVRWETSGSHARLVPVWTR